MCMFRYLIQKSGQIRQSGKMCVIEYLHTPILALWYNFFIWPNDKLGSRMK